MHFDPWFFWLLVAIIFFIIEIFTPGFLMACIGIGCLFGSAGAVFHASLNLQFILFSIGALISFFTVRPLMLKYAYKRSKSVKTNVDAMIGKKGKVLVTIDEEKGEGRVAIDGDDWKAISEDGGIIQAGKKVEVVKVESIILTVKPI